MQIRFLRRLLQLWRFHRAAREAVALRQLGFWHHTAVGKGSKQQRSAFGYIGTEKPFSPYGVKPHSTWLIDSRGRSWLCRGHKNMCQQGYREVEIMQGASISVM